ncbi:hypothetical protein SARC_15775, partial [Sphaeroforma arctica JP610]
MGKPASAPSQPKAETVSGGVSITTLFVLGVALLMGIRAIEGPALDAKTGTIQLAAQNG